MAIKRTSKEYICEGCGRTFKSQGIGPHQRKMGHVGKRLVHESARPIANVIDVPARVQNVAPVRQIKPHTRPAAVLRLTVMPYVVVQDENGRHGLLQWEDENNA